MACYRSGGCGPYEMRSCSECPASKPEYTKRMPEAKSKGRTYCVNAQCPFVDCEHHLTNAPTNTPIVMSGMDGVCRRYIDFLVDELTKGGDA